MILDPEDIRSRSFFEIVFQILIATGNHEPGSSQPETQDMKDVLALPHPQINAVMIKEMLPQEDPIPHVLFVPEIMRVLPEIMIYLFQDFI